MAIKKLPILPFLEQSKGELLLDVRSPAEYNHAHIPGAYSLPLFSDEERKIVGTDYKQRSRQQAIKSGLDFFGVKMKLMVEEVEAIIASQKSKKEQPKIFVHCWRGGMRSAGVAWLLDLYGFDVYTLTGGYKAFRNWVLLQFEMEYELQLIGGYTGSGKTAILSELEKEGNPVIDLEKLANHRGSAFGAMPNGQPTQEMFENKLALALNEQSKLNSVIWVEDESQRIGQLNIPHTFWTTMRNRPVVFMDIPFEKRLAYIESTYGLNDKEKLVNAIIRIQKRLGPMETKTAIGFLLENNFAACFEILLHYYDKFYAKGLYNRENADGLIKKVECSTVDAHANSLKLLSCVTINS